MKLPLTLILVIPVVLAAQERSSIATLRDALVRAGWSDVETGKCGTPLIFDATRKIRELPSGVQKSVATILQRVDRQKSRPSPSGKFRIHYDTTSTNQPARIVNGSRVPNSHEEYVDSVGAVFDRCWQEQVETLGYLPPPSDGGAGSGLEYDIYIENLNPGVFGYTSYEGEVKYETGEKERTASFIVIDNDFLNYRTSGWNGLRVTAAHELFHAIQIGAYGIWNTVPYSDFYFYELTSVWMEEVLYDEINDYLYDLPRFFQTFRDPLNRSFSFSEFFSRKGYERSVFAFYLDQRFGKDILRNIWNEVASRPLLPSLELVLRQHGSSLSDAFAEFAFWNLFTGSKADTLRFYREGRLFPQLALNATTNFSGSTSMIRGAAHPFSIQYYGCPVSADTVVAIVVEKDFERAYLDPDAFSDLEVRWSTATPTGATMRLDNGITAGFVVQQPENWRTRFVSATSLRDLRRDAQPFPNPLVLSKAEMLFLPADGSSPGPGEVFFLTSSFDLAFSATFPVVDILGKSVMQIPVARLHNKIGTGVHYILLKTREREYEWKLAVVR